MVTDTFSQTKRVMVSMDEMQMILFKHLACLKTNEFKGIEWCWMWDALLA